MSWLQIANDPPPLREIPPNCSPLTSEVIKLGLQKDPAKRSSASDLKEKTARALKKGNSLHRSLVLVGTNLHLNVEQSMFRVQDKMHQTQCIVFGLQWEDSPAQWKDPIQSPCILLTNLLTPCYPNTAAVAMRTSRNIKSLLRKWSQQTGRRRSVVTTMKRRTLNRSEMHLSFHKRWCLSHTTRTRSPLCLNLSCLNWSKVGFWSLFCSLFFR